MRKLTAFHDYSERAGNGKMDILENMIAYYNNGENEAFHYALRKILANFDVFFNNTIYDTAEMCSSSTSTISRLSSALGYRSYSAFRTSFFDAMLEYYYLNRIIPSKTSDEPGDVVDTYFSGLEDVLRRTRESADKAVLSSLTDELHNAESVHFYSFNSQFSEIWLQINLMVSGKETIIKSRFHDQIDDMNALQQGALVFVVAPSDNSGLDALPLLTTSREKGAKSVFITNSTHSRCKDMADYCLSFEGVGTRLDHYGMQMYFDLLSAMYRKKYIDKDQGGNSQGVMHF